MSLEIIDTHVHLNLGQYEEDQAAVIERAKQAGISRMVSSGVTVESCQGAIQLAEKYPGLMHCGVSIHPQDTLKWTDDTYTQLKEMSTHSSVVAIGETGLDYFRDYAPHDVQQHAFRQHIHLAQETGLPLIIHVRDKGQEAYDDLLQILKEEEAEKIGGVMHCFSGNQEFAEESIKLNFYAAFGGVITFKNAKDLQAVAQNVPLKHILLETDCPWLAPTPYRGKRNEPAYVVKVAEKLAELQNKTLTEVAEITTQNAKKLFKF